MKNLDQFYTCSELAEQYVESILKKYNIEGAALVEPSAGTGAFIKPLIDRGFEVTALDIDPQGENIEKEDFFEWTDWPDSENIIVIGNPPFGFAASLAIKFFNRAAEHANIIAFILPRTFRKISVQDKLNRYFWLSHDEDVPDNSFIKDGLEHDVPCAWQIWERRDEKRPPQPIPDVSNIILYTTQDQADFAVRRVGGRAGAILPIVDGPYSKSSTYFIQSMRPDAETMMKNIDWSDIRNSTAGVRSISKREIAVELDKLVNRP